jgi:alkanesulfonate monooxygenase SsuD/methylene tetrahydromethanopterin reductase-like flavin-dependent oxidoreductase (luciferase family)
MRTKLAKAGALGVMRDYPEQPDSELSTRRCAERLVIAGTPESVADQILAFRKEVGTFGTLLYTGHDWTDPSLARRSMELMANEVWPRIDRAAHGTTPRTQTDGKACSG